MQKLLVRFPFRPHHICYQFRAKLFSKHMTNIGARVNIMLTLVPGKGTEPEHFLYSYVCKTSHPGCSHVQKRANTTTDKLKQKVLKCNVAHLGAVSPMKTPHKTVTKVNKHHHRMLLALRCAVSNRPFALSEDDFYRLEVEYLRPGMCDCLLGAISFSKLTWIHGTLHRHYSSLSEDSQ